MTEIKAVTQQYYSGPPVEGITPERAIFIYHLRVNPHGIRQTSGTMYDALSGARCALGLGCQAFNIDLTSYSGLDKAYHALSNLLQVSSDEIESMWKLNDRFGMSFAEVAARMESYFKNREAGIIRQEDFKKPYGNKAY